MSSLNLGGFDVVVHLAESVINQGLELLPNGSTFPVDARQNVSLTALGVPIPGLNSPTKDVPLLYDSYVELERPQVTFDQANNRVIVRCTFSPASQLTFLQPTTAADATLLTGIFPQIPIAGTVELSCPFGTSHITAVWGAQPVSGRAAVARATGVAATVSLLVPSADASGNVLLATSVIGTQPVRVTSAAIQNAIQSALGTKVGDAIGNLPLTNPVLLNAGTTPPQRVRDLRAQISPSGSAPGIGLGVLTDIAPASPGGNIPAPPVSLGSTGALLWVANYWTLHLVCSAISAAHPAITFTFDPNGPSATFTGSVVIAGGEEPLKLKRMTISAFSGILTVEGHATASGGCWDAKIDFNFNLTLTCDPNTGAITTSASVPEVDIDVDKDVLCQIIGAILGALAGIVTGALVGAIIGAIAGGGPGALVGGLIGGVVGGVVGGIAGWVAAGELIDPLDLDGVSLDSLSVLGGLTLPLPVGSAGLIVDACDFDDLAVNAKLAYVDLAERHRAGSVYLDIGSGFDLDGGIVRPALDGVADDAADLFWGGAALQTLPGSVIGPVFGSTSKAFGTTSLTDLEGFTYGTNSISAQQIPIELLVSMRFVGGHALDAIRRGGWVTFAVRTDEGRYAKCRAHREIGGRLILEYVVYARPRLCLGSILTLETLSRIVVESGTVACTKTREELVVSPGIVVRPLPPDMSLDGRVLTRGEPYSAFAAPNRVVDRFEIPLRGVRLPPKKPAKSCGPNTTIEVEEVDWQIVDRKQQARLRAIPRGASAPLVYRWDVFGSELTGSGSEMVGSVQATFDENSPILTLVADEGVDLIGSIVIHATDADGRVLRVTRQINSQSRKREGGCCETRRSKLTLPDAAALLDQARVAQRIHDVGMARLRGIAASAPVRDSESVPVVDAVARLTSSSVSDS